MKEPVLGGESAHNGSRLVRRRGEIPRERGEIRAAITRHFSHRKRMVARDDEGRPAHTSYRVLERLRGATLVEAILHTGRTHQVRVHFQHLGHPLLGDATYGARQNRRLEELHHFRAERQMLHASRIAFTHPRSGERLTLEAPWPQDFRDALAALRENL
jgi:23S rRNA pseudouridine1911/1915/1917 synthase